MRIPEDVLQTIRSRVSIVDVVGRHVDLKHSGKNWKGLCPFHAEKTPSFIVNEERGSYHCFGCGVGGSAFRFLMDVEGRTFLDVVRSLAEQVGVELGVGLEDPRGRQEREEREELLEILALAARYYRHQLVEGRAGERAREYLQRREIPPETAEDFGLGCAPEGWDHLTRFLRRRGLDLERAARAGLLAERASGGFYDRLRGRLVFPICDAMGRPVSFGGRVLGEGEPKYLNGPESAVFRKGELLYGLHQGRDAIRKQRRAILVEGYMDVISLHARGFPNSLATLGTAMTVEHIQALRRRVDEVVLVYDGDDAGRRAAFRSLDLFLSEGFPCRVVLLPAEHDPDTFVREGGDLAARVQAAEPLFEAYLAEVGRGSDLGTVEGKLAAVETLLPRLGAVSDELARDLYVRRVAERLGVDEARLHGRLRSSARAPSSSASRQGAPREEALDPLERAVVERLADEPERRPGFLERGVDGWMRPGALREAARFVAGRGEPAKALPLDDAPEAVRVVLSEVLVAEGGLLAAPYGVLEARLRLRELEARAVRLLDGIRQAEAAADERVLLERLREKTELDRALVECRREASGKGAH